MSTSSNNAGERTPQDYAIEHAEYMARAAERLIESVNAVAALRIRIAESDDVTDDDEHDVQATVDERLRAMRNSIYEFRKRRDRALSTAGAAAAPVGIIDRLEAALKRIENGHSIRRIPADPTDPDLVLAECKAYFQGRPAPFWVPKDATQPSPAYQTCGGTGEVLDHADGCVDDLCALNGDEHSCSGRVESCECAQRSPVAAEPTGWTPLPGKMPLPDTLPSAPKEGVMSDHEKGFLAGTVSALAVIYGFDEETAWREVLRTSGEASVLYYAAHIEPEDWEFAGFAAYKCKKPRKQRSQGVSHE